MQRSFVIAICNTSLLTTHIFYFAQMSTHGEAESLVVHKWVSLNGVVGDIQVVYGFRGEC